MAFPTNPTNGQTTVINGVTYTYSTALTAWTVTSSGGSLTSATDITVSGNVTIGNPLAVASGGTGVTTATGSTAFAAPDGTNGAPSFRNLLLTDMPEAWPKRSVRAATTANITLSGTQTIDDIALVAGDRVLVKSQTAGADNGIYVVSASTWSRSPDGNTISKLAGAVVNVDSGTVNGGRLFDTDLKSTDTLGVTTNNWYSFVDVNGSTFTGTVTLRAGTATANTAPLYMTSGTNLTVAAAGAVEYDGNNLYFTPDTSQGRNVIQETQQFYLSAAGGALTGATQNYFGSTSAASLAAASTYDIDCYCYFLKTTSGTVQWIPTFSSAVTVGHSYLEYTPVTGFTTTVITGAMVVSEATQQTTTVLTHLATAALTSAVYHVHKLRIRVTTNLACNFRLNNTIGTGSITPQAGSFYTVRKVVTSAGNFVA